MDTPTRDLTVNLCAARLHCAGHALADLWDACRILEGITGTEVDGISDMLSRTAEGCIPPDNLPSLDDCAQEIRTLFGISV